MKIKVWSLSLLFFLLLNSCSNNTSREEAKKPMLVPQPQKIEDPYKALHFDDKYDLVCGMPITAGISDTAHYKEKLYGFCSKECKEAFTQDPVAYVGTNKKAGKKQ